MTTSTSVPAWHGAPSVVVNGVSGVAGAARALRGLCTPATLTGGLTELAWVGAHALLWPLGTRAEVPVPDARCRPDRQPPSVRAFFAADPLAARVPVVLVHGMVDNRSIFTVMSRSLRRRGFTSVSTWNYSPLVQDVRVAAGQLAEHLARVCEQTGHDRVHVVGHSLGGIVARYLVQCGDADRVASLTTLGSPHGGTLWAHAVPTPLIRQLRSGSDLMAELDRPAPGVDIPVTAVYSDLDQLVLPVSHGRCDHPDLRARNVLVHGVGHMSLPIHRAVVDEVAATLAGHRATGRGTHVAAA
ncbi:Alpha/beta hydrolase family protein [Klenkia soli]|uniref:Alpha/beta hydrolase family protein n=1 Tax=Klenkia soli TaxID=1052260 RepID=A0A1H0CUJ4_9ACTN|nr:alpha/beta fold hydrolase [Klenkia soli]SDN61485.1 Alpha/beta hydrolase family protein [Klenkia soli]